MEKPLPYFDRQQAVLIISEGITHQQQLCHWSNLHTGIMWYKSTTANAMKEIALSSP